MSTSGPGQWYGPSDEWPSHSKPWFRQALMKARRSGWWYKKAGASAHIHGTAYCQRQEQSASSCKFVVFSTGVAGESAARDLERLIARCPHSVSDDADALAAASLQMEKVDALCHAAAALLDQRDHEEASAALLDRADQLLQEAGDGVAEVDKMISEALDFDLEARAAADEAERDLAMAAEETRDPSRVLDLAEDGTSQVRATLRNDLPSSEARDLKRRVQDAQARIRKLRSRLSQT